LLNTITLTNLSHSSLHLPYQTPFIPLQPLQILTHTKGYTQSGPLFRAKTRALEKLLAKTLAPAGLVPVCIYPTAPNRLYARDIPGFHQVPEGSGEQEEEEIDSWAWFRKDEASGQYRLLSEGMMALADTMRAANSPGAQVVDGEVVVKTLVGDAAGVVEGEAGEQGKEGEKKKHIDGVIGFSQGGAMAAMLASALEFTLGETHRALPKTDKSAAAAWAEALRSANNDVPLKFAVSYSGFYGVPEDLNWLYEPKIKTPTLHFLGSLDTVVDESRSQGLIDRCEDPVVVVHPGGHYVPINKEWVMPLVGFIQNCCLVDQKPKKEEKEDTDEEFPF